MTDLQPAAPPVPEADERVEAPAVPSPSPPRPLPRRRRSVRHQAGTRPPRPPDDPAAGRRDSTRCSSRSPACTATLHPKADLALLQRAYDVADGQARGPEAQVRRPVHHPPARRRDDPRRAGHGHHHAGRRAAARHRGGHRLLAGAAARPTSARRSRTSSTASPSSTRSSSATRPRPRPSARWSSRWPATRGCWSSSSRDRLHNMRTMRFLPPEKQAKKARETLEVLAPLAHRLGMATVKWELEDLSFAILHPKKYSEIVRLVADPRAVPRHLPQAGDRRGHRSSSTRRGSPPTVEGRPKHYYSIYRKMIVKGRDFDDIHDLVGVRVLVDEVRDCYAAMGMVHALWQPMPGRFKDYIAQPRFGVYQSLHTTVIGPDGKPLEVQIRTHEMHRTAEYGIAAHWRYKETRGSSHGRGQAVEVDEMAWMRQLLDWQREAADPGDFLESLRFDLAARRSSSSRPKGDVITLPIGVHAGGPGLRRAHRGRAPVHRLAGQRPAGRAGAASWSPATSSRSSPRKAETRRPEPRLAGVRRVAAGQDEDQAVVRQGAPRGGHRGRQGGHHPRGAAHRDAAAAAGLGGRDGGAGPRAALPGPVRAVRRGRGGARLSARHVVQRLVALLGGVEEAEEELAERATPSTVRQRKSAGDAGVVVRGDDGLIDGLYTKLARCCTPVPGDDILGFVTRGGGGQRAPHRLHERRRPAGAGRAAGRRARGRCRRGRCSSSRSRSRRSTGTGCCPTSPRCWPTRRSTSSRRRCRPRATGWRSPGSPSRWATPSTSGTCCGRCATSRASTTCTG